MRYLALLLLIACGAFAAEPGLNITRLWGGFRPTNGSGFDIPWRFSDYNDASHPSETGGHQPVTTGVIYVHGVVTQGNPNLAGELGRIAVFRVLPNNNGQVSHTPLTPELREFSAATWFPRPLRVAKPADDSPAFIVSVGGVGPENSNVTGAVHIYWTAEP
jgi:hypothetical protein